MGTVAGRISWHTVGKRTGMLEKHGCGVTPLPLRDSRQTAYDTSRNRSAGITSPLRAVWRGELRFTKTAVRTPFFGWLSPEQIVRGLRPDSDRRT